MKFHIKNYRTFILSALIFSIVVFLLIWGFLTVFSRGVDSFKGMTESAEITTNVTASDPDNPLLAIVSDTKTLSEDYVPLNLVTFVNTDGTEIEISNEVLESLRNLVDDAADEGYEFVVSSGYRSYEEQQERYEEAIEGVSQIIGSEDVAGGTSEHQTGLAVDIVTPETDYTIRQDFALTDESKWLEDNAAEYGFIIRYPQGKEDITHNIYEPWHLRYVGKTHATIITDNHLVLEEYVQIDEEQ